MIKYASYINAVVNNLRLLKGRHLRHTTGFAEHLPKQVRALAETQGMTRQQIADYIDAYTDGHGSMEHRGRLALSYANHERVDDEDSKFSGPGMDLQTVSAARLYNVQKRIAQLAKGTPQQRARAARYQAMINTLTPSKIAAQNDVLTGDVSKLKAAGWRDISKMYNYSDPSFARLNPSTGRAVDVAHAAAVNCARLFNAATDAGERPGTPPVDINAVRNSNRPLAALNEQLKSISDDFAYEGYNDNPDPGYVDLNKVPNIPGSYSPTYNSTAAYRSQRPAQSASPSTYYSSVRPTYSLNPQNAWGTYTSTSSVGGQAPSQSAWNTGTGTPTATRSRTAPSRLTPEQSRSILRPVLLKPVPRKLTPEQSRSILRPVLLRPVPSTPRATQTREEDPWGRSTYYAKTPEQIKEDMEIWG